MAQISMKMKDEDKEVITQFCKERGMSFVGFLRVAIKGYLGQFDIEIFKED